MDRQEQDIKVLMWVMGALINMEKIGFSEIICVDDGQFSLKQMRKWDKLDRKIKPTDEELKTAITHLLKDRHEGKEYKNKILDLVLIDIKEFRDNRESVTKKMKEKDKELEAIAENSAKWVMGAFMELHILGALTLNQTPSVIDKDRNEWKELDSKYKPNNDELIISLSALTKLIGFGGGDMNSQISMFSAFRDDREEYIKGLNKWKKSGSPKTLPTQFEGSFGIIAIRKETNEVVHCVLYEREPTPEDFINLKQELMTDESHGFVGEDLLLQRMPEEILKEMKESTNVGVIHK